MILFPPFHIHLKYSLRKHLAGNYKGTSTKALGTKKRSEVHFVVVLAADSICGQWLTTLSFCSSYVLLLLSFSQSLYLLCLYRPVCDLITYEPVEERAFLKLFLTLLLCGLYRLVHVPIGDGFRCSKMNGYPVYTTTVFMLLWLLVR